VRTSSSKGSTYNTGSRKKADQVQISGNLIARNTILNLIGQALPLLVGVVTIPLVVHGLGTEQFGLLSLAWVVLGYFTIFDLGLGRATTKYVAEALSRGEEDQVPQIIWTAVAFQTVLGFIGAIILFGITDLLVERVLNIPLELWGEAIDIFHLLALSIPLVLVSSSFNGVLEAAQRFDLVNAIRVPSSILISILPLVGLYLGFGLSGIVILIVLARLGTLVVVIWMDFRIVPELRKYSVSLARFSRLFAFGGWIMITSIVGPILVYLDRFLIGSLLTIAAVAYYTAPYEMVTRLLIISTSIAMTLFPAFSAMEGIRDRQRLSMFFARSIKYVFLISGTIVVLIIVYAKEILQIWLGNDFAIESTVALQILAIGVLINSLAYTPFTLLQGVGRPDLPAKFHLIELPIYAGIAWILVSEFGIAGAAGAWTIRVALDTVLLFIATPKVYCISPNLLAESGMKRATIGLVVFAGIAYGLKEVAYALPIATQLLLLTGFLGLSAWVAWNFVMDDLDRMAVTEIAALRKILERVS
jgi:O-antigen/teichoic acid export membrane protein